MCCTVFRQTLAHGPVPPIFNFFHVKRTTFMCLHVLMMILPSDTSCLTLHETVQDL